MLRNFWYFMGDQLNPANAQSEGPVRGCEVNSINENLLRQLFLRSQPDASARLLRTRLSEGQRQLARLEPSTKIPVSQGQGHGWP